MMEASITENVNREDLTPVEEARGYQVLYEEFNYSYRNIAERDQQFRGALPQLPRQLHNHRDHHQHHRRVVDEGRGDNDKQHQ